jgi:IrrE N-terminal-like domain
MTRDDPYAFASRAAEQCIRGMPGATLPIDPIAIARSKAIEVIPKPLGDTAVSGMLIRVGQEYVIAYATHIDNEGFQRFSIGHELGHYLLPGHPDAVLDATGVHQSRAGFRSIDRYETEADRFAAGLLMPRHLFGPALERLGQGFGAVESLANLCKTSLHATAVRYAQCSPDPVAIIVSTADWIDHCFMSDELKTLDGIDWLRKHDSLPRSSATYAFNKNPANSASGERVEGTSNLRDWFGGSYDIDVAEDVVGLGSYGKTLTVLYNIDLPDEEERDQDTAMRESWQPRFRR